MDTVRPISLEHSQVVILQDIEDASFAAGDVGTVVHICGGAATCEVEFIDLSGEAIAVVMLPIDQVRAPLDDEIASARYFGTDVGEIARSE